jgi:hypothetical protein
MLNCCLGGLTMLQSLDALVSQLMSSSQTLKLYCRKGLDSFFTKANDTLVWVLHVKTQYHQCMLSDT